MLWPLQDVVLCLSPGKLRRSQRISVSADAVNQKLIKKGVDMIAAQTCAVCASELACCRKSYPQGKAGAILWRDINCKSSKEWIFTTINATVHDREMNNAIFSHNGHGQTGLFPSHLTKQSRGMAPHYHNTSLQHALFSPFFVWCALAC